VDRFRRSLEDSTRGCQHRGVSETFGSAAPDDAALVAAVARAERDAFAALYDRYAPLLLGAAHGVLRNRRDAEDLLHDVFLEVWHKASGYDPARGSVRSWLLLRVRSRAIDRVRSLTVARRHGMAPPEEAESAAGAGAEAALLMSADAGRVREALRSLPDAQRTLVELAFFEGLSCTELAQRCELPVGTVKSRLARALGKLREGLGAEGSGR
jgi:RNA polymerase sigma-70 factor (ECF subfamily)